MSAPREALVTGGAGFIGSHLADRLVAEGVRVRILDDLSTGREENLADVRDRVELVVGDLRDAEVVARAARGVDWIFHEGAIASVPASVRDPLGTEAVNVGGTLHVLEAARAAGVKRVVFAASAAVYGDGEELPKHEDMEPRPLSPYALQKYASECYCRYYTRFHGVPTAALRYFNVFGPRQDPASPYSGVISLFVEACLKQVPPRLLGDGAQTRDFVFVSDVVEANWLAATRDEAVGRVLNVASGTRTSIKRLLEVIQDAVGSDLAPLHEAAREGDVPHSLADIARATSVLGYHPAVELAEGIQRTVHALRGKAS